MGVSCPKCDCSDTQTVDSRPAIRLGRSARRRRVYCPVCDVRFTTIESVAEYENHEKDVEDLLLKRIHMLDDERRLAMYAVLNVIAPESRIRRKDIL